MSRLRIRSSIRRRLILDQHRLGAEVPKQGYGTSGRRGIPGAKKRDDGGLMSADCVHKFRRRVGFVRQAKLVAIHIEVYAEGFRHLK